MAQDENRRPLASRDSGWARTIARKLSTASVTPNQISQASMGFAALGLLCFWAVAYTGTLGQSILLCLAALMVQMRLLCNLLDGMVAVERDRPRNARNAFDAFLEFPDVRHTEPRSRKSVREVGTPRVHAHSPFRHDDVHRAASNLFKQDLARLSLDATDQKPHRQPKRRK